MIMLLSHFNIYHILNIKAVMSFELIKAPENAIITSKYLNKKVIVMNRLKPTVVSDGFY
jgi:pyruvate/2-oxoglutarate dehydrogenase complex dihydrolipoamide acyltransferase (E2) component